MQFMGQIFSSSVPNNISFYKNDWDGTLRTEDGTVFQIHRFLLIRYEYFRALFNFEVNTTDILMKGIESHTLRIIIQYIYEGILQLDEEDVLDLMIAADYLLLDDIMVQCRDFAIRHMTPRNCLNLLITALRFEHFNILRECSRYVKVHFEVIIKNFPDKIADLPIEILTEILKDSSLNVMSEDTVWTTIVIWVKADLLKRNQYIPDLFNCVRFKEEQSLILKVVHNIVGIFNPLSHSPSESSFLQRILYRETASRLPKYLHVVVNCRISPSEMYLTCDEELDFWRKVANAPLIPDSILSIGNYVYLFVTYENVLIRYDLLNDTFISLRGIVNRINHLIVELDKKIYILGGSTETFDDSDSVECYDPVSERWNRVKTLYDTTLMMASGKIIMAAAAMCGKLYAIGHTYLHQNRFQRVMWMSVYNPITDTWNTAEPPRLLDPTFCVVAFENRLYLIGEGNSHKGLIYAREYDPVLNVWTWLPDLPLKYLKPKFLVLAGRLLVFDNYHKDNYNEYRCPVSPPVYWDGVSGTWKITDKSFAFYNNLERYRFGIVDIPAVVREVVNRRRRSTVQYDRIFSSE